MASRQSLITALKLQLSKISIVNGYTTDIGSNVDEWRLAKYSVEELPVIEIRDADLTPEDMNNTLSNNALNIIISVYDSPTSNAGETARKYINDVLNAIGSDTSIDNNAYQVDLNNTTIEADQNGEISINAIIDITAYYQTKKWSE